MSFACNWGLKRGLHRVRPFWLAPRIRCLPPPDAEPTGPALEMGEFPARKREDSEKGDAPPVRHKDAPLTDPEHCRSVTGLPRPPRICPPWLPAGIGRLPRQGGTHGSGP